MKTSKTVPLSLPTVWIVALAILGLVGEIPAATNYFDSFETYATGSLLIGQGGWQQLSGTGSNDLLTVQTGAAAIQGTNYFRLEVRNATPMQVQDPSILTQVAMTNGMIQWYVNAQQNSLANGLGATILDNNGAGYLAKIFLTGFGNFKYTSGGTTVDTGVSYLTNDWYRIRLNFGGGFGGSASTYDLSIFDVTSNATAVSVVNIPYWTAGAVTNIYRVDFATMNDAGFAGVYYLDALQVLPVPEPNVGALVMAALMFGAAAKWRLIQRS